jgi:hypothetical protein
MDVGRKESSTTSHMAVGVMFTQYRPQPVPASCVLRNATFSWHLLLTCGSIKETAPRACYIQQTQIVCQTGMSYAADSAAPVNQHDAVKAVWKVGIKLRVFLTLAVDGGAFWMLGSGRLSLDNRWIGNWVDCQFSDELPLLFSASFWNEHVLNNDIILSDSARHKTNILTCLRTPPMQWVPGALSRG